MACEVTLQPVDLLGVDAAILFSDILVVPEAMGLPYQLIEKVGSLVIGNYGPFAFEVARVESDVICWAATLDAKSYVIDLLRLLLLFGVPASLSRSRSWLDCPDMIDYLLSEENPGAIIWKEGRDSHRA